MNNLNSKRDESLEAKIRFRCPNCSKLYISNPALIFVEKPEYKCTSCNTKFYISLSESLNASEVVGYEIKEELKVLSSDETLQSEDVSKLEKTPEPEFKPSDINWSVVDSSVDFKIEGPEEPLEELWQTLLNDFDNQSLHKEFVDLSKKKDQIDFAKTKYGELLKANPFDKIARSSLNRIQIEEETSVLLAKEKDRQQMGMNLWSTLVVAIGLCLILLGAFVVPEYQKLVGLGLGLVVFTFALKSLFQKSQAPY